MVYKKSVMKMVNNVVKFVSVVLLCLFCILVSRHYCQIKNYATALYKSLNIIIFFTENSHGRHSDVLKEIKSTNLVFIKEYVDANGAYLKSIKKNPFLKDISILSDTESSIQAYAIATSRFIPKKNLMLNMKKILEKISGVDEVIFDMSIFEQYAKTKNLLSVYKKIFLVFEVVVFILFILKCIFLIIECKLNIKKLITNVFLYLSYSVFAFIVFWIVCNYMYCPILINDIATVLSIVIFVAALGIILN
ncbi:MAG: hypothetical protein LBS15_02435 [Endomicrobium sp.]|nr:hypothetical protein [Endomicrobium sp.]